jgi:prepilin peptidase CpaA
MALQPLAAMWFLLIAVPVGLFVTFSDLSRMKIPNVAVAALFVGYVVIGIFVLPFPTYLWGLAHVIIMMIVGIMLNAADVMGAGDAKFIGAAAAFVPFADAITVLTLLAVSLLGALATHRIARATSLRAQVPHWESWATGKRFPMGFPLSMTLIGYLVLAALQG